MRFVQTGVPLLSNQSEAVLRYAVIVILPRALSGEVDAGSPLGKRDKTKD
jgi:hypothetical protein